MSRSDAERKEHQRQLRDDGRKSCRAYPTLRTIEFLCARKGYDPAELDDRQVALILGYTLDEMTEWLAAGPVE